VFCVKEKVVGSGRANQVHQVVWVAELVCLTSSALELDHLEDAILHLANSLVLGQAHATLVGNIVDAALRLGVLATGAADLQVVLGGDVVQL